MKLSWAETLAATWLVAAIGAGGIIGLAWVVGYLARHVDVCIAVLSALTVASVLTLWRRF